MMNTHNTQTTTCTQECGRSIFWLGFLFLVCAIGAALVLAGTKLGLYAHAPGCGLDSGCNAIANGPWGKIPFLGWPVSFVGVAWFGSILAVWCRGGMNSTGFVYLVRTGVIASLVFFVVMFAIGHFCVWCAVAHICNICFWLAVEVLRKRVGFMGNDRPSCFSAQLFLLVFVCTSALLGVIWFLVGSIQTGEEELAGKINAEDIVLGTGDQSTLSLLKADHRIGPRDAVVQIVIFTDYQCPDCKKYEQDMVKIVEERDNVSLSIKHFPMCADCNAFMNGRTMHGNACWAARAAETAAILGGEDGWERMHTWLFEQNGQFTDQTFNADLVRLGFDPQEFIPIMMGNETLGVVKGDVDDAIKLGLSYTPMIFINGVEYLWYYRGQQEPIASLVDRASAAAAAGGGRGVAPPSASEKLFTDWRRGKFYATPGTDGLLWRGDGPVEVVVWGDYQEPYTRELQQEINALLTTHGADVRYAFRYFPIDESCNAGVSGFINKYGGSCDVSKLVEAVGVVGGNRLRWEMHDWVISQPTPIDVEFATEHAANLVGENTQTIIDITNSIEVSNRMRVDIMSKNQVRRRSVPVLTINGKFVPKWKSDFVDAQTLLQGIIEEAGSDATSK